jgi:hypothetical protein
MLCNNEYFAKKNLISSKIAVFFYSVPIRANLLSGTNIFSTKIFFSFWMQKIKENFISFRNMFLKNKKTCKSVELYSKNKKILIYIEIRIFCTFLKSFFNMRYLTDIIIKLFFYRIFYRIII